MKLLFICTHNRCRSILAEAITNHRASPHIRASSAGSSPQGVVHPLSLQYLVENDIPIHNLKSQSWHDFENYKPDAVITLCESAAHETCPIWFGETVQVHWGMDDPSKQLSDSDDYNQAVAFNNTINILERRIDCLLDALSAAVDDNGSDSKLVGSKLRSVLMQIAIQNN